MMKLFKITKKHMSILNQLDELFETEHGGCEDSTCNISVAFNHGYTIHALECFYGSGASSDEFNALFEKLPKKLIQTHSRHEAELMCAELSHATCPHCNAVSWELEWIKDSKNKIWCASCAGTYSESEGA